MYTCISREPQTWMFEVILLIELGARIHLTYPYTPIQPPLLPHRQLLIVCVLKKCKYHFSVCMYF